MPAQDRCSIDLPPALAGDAVFAGLVRRAQARNLSAAIAVHASGPRHFEIFSSGECVGSGLDRGGLLERLCSVLSAAVPAPIGAAKFRGAVVSRGGDAVLLIGPDGRGITSLVAWFIESGFQYLADESFTATAKKVDGFAGPLKLRRDNAKHLTVLERIGSAPAAFAGESVYFDPADEWCGIGPKTPRLIVFPRFRPESAMQLEMLPPFQAARRMVLALPGLDIEDDGQLSLPVALAAAAPAIGLTYGNYLDIEGLLDRLARVTLSERLSVADFGRFFGGFERSSKPFRYPAPEKSPVKEAKRFTIGMATYDDYDGVYFSIQSIRLHHPEILDEAEFLIVDNNPNGPCGAPLKELERSILNLRYVPVADVTGTAVRDRIFREATGEFVLCMDCHVLFPAGTLRRLFDYFEKNPGTNDLLQGPLVFDNMTKLATHFDPEWSEGMYGKWGMDERGTDSEAAPFDIPMQGLGAFACRRAVWPGFNPVFRGFGGEEGYIHEKFRQAGGRTLCLPFFRWLHRFGRPLGTRYRNVWEDRFHNYFVGFREIGWPVEPIETHMKELLGEAPALRMIAAIRAELDGTTPAPETGEEYVEENTSRQIGTIGERLLAMALADHVSSLLDPASVLLAGPSAEHFEKAFTAAGARCFPAQENADAATPASLAISVAAVSNDSPSQAKRHVALMTSSAEAVLFMPAQASRSRGHDPEAGLAYWRELFARRGFTPVEDFRRGMALDPRIPAERRSLAGLYRRQSPAADPARRPAIRRGEYANGVSVILPVFNGEKYLDQAIQSILAQTHGEFEFIIVDDGSTDGSADIADSYARHDARLRLIRQANAGEPTAANLAVTAARYGLVARMDHDDVSLPHRLAKQYAFLIANEKIAVVGAFMQPIDETGKPFAQLMRYPVRPVDCNAVLSQGFVGPVGNPAAMYRRDAALDIGGYRKQFCHAADFDFWLRLGAHHGMANIPEVLVAYRLHGENMTRKKRLSQTLDAILARCAADCRRRGKPDPLDEVQSISLDQLGLFDFDGHQTLDHYQMLYQVAAVPVPRTRRPADAAHAVEFLRRSLALPGVELD